MALATRCPHCNTAFKVANDQLKLHAGLVRCGSCRQTFNGVEHLIAIDNAGAAEPVPVAEPLTIAEPLAVASVVPVVPVAPVIPDAPLTPVIPSSMLDFDLGDEVALDATSQTDELRETLKPLEPLEPPALTWPSPLVISEAESTHEPYLDDSLLDEQVSAAERDDEDEDEDEALAEDDEDKPDFVRQAERAQRRSRLLRLLAIVSCLLLLPLLLVQLLYLTRVPLAANFPELRAPLLQACQLLQCQLPWPAQIEQLSIESNELQSITPEGRVFSLSMQLQNHASTVQAWPVVELVLNDEKDRAVLQKAFMPSDYLSERTLLEKGFVGGSEQNFKIYFSLPKLKAAGYHVSIFYP